MIKICVGLQDLDLPAPLLTEILECDGDCVFFGLRHLSYHW